MRMLFVMAQDDWSQAPTSISRRIHPSKVRTGLNSGEENIVSAYALKSVTWSCQQRPRGYRRIVDPGLPGLGR